MNKAGQSLKWVLLDLIHKCNDLRSFKQIHAHLLTSALVTNDLVVTKAANFLGKHITDVHYPCNFLKQFDWSLSSFPCNLLISGYASGQLPWLAILIYRWTVRNGFVPDVGGEIHHIGNDNLLDFHRKLDVMKRDEVTILTFVY